MKKDKRKRFVKDLGDMKDGQIHKLFLKWKTRLKLDHWDVKFEVVDTSVLDAGSGGNAECDFEYLMSTIQIARNSSEGNPVHKIDLALGIIHELLHLHLSGLKAICGTPEHTAEEQAIQILSRVIMEGYEGSDN